MSSYQDSFAFKLSAAKYHISQIQLTYRANPSLFNSAEDSPTIRPIYYHYHALIYEFCAALDMTLQMINDQENLGFESEKVFWKDKQPTKFQQSLQAAQPDIYRLFEQAYLQEWSIALRESRNHLLHRGNISLLVGFNDERISIINPVINEKVFHFDINLWGENISNLFNSIYKED